MVESIDTYNHMQRIWAAFVQTRDHCSLWFHPFLTDVTSMLNQAIKKWFIQNFTHATTAILRTYQDIVADLIMDAWFCLKRLVKCTPICIRLVMILGLYSTTALGFLPVNGRTQLWSWLVADWTWWYQVATLQNLQFWQVWVCLSVCLYVCLFVLR